MSARAKRTPWELADDRERGLKLDPLNLSAADAAEARALVVTALRELKVSADQGWVRARDLFDHLLAYGWPYPDPNYIVGPMKKEELIEEDFRETAPGSGAHAPYWRLALSATEVRPGTRSRASGLADTGEES